MYYKVQLYNDHFYKIVAGTSKLVIKKAIEEGKLNGFHSYRMLIGKLWQNKIWI